jgi:hypothetical protein
MQSIGCGEEYFEGKTFTADSNYHSPVNSWFGKRSHFTKSFRVSRRQASRRASINIDGPVKSIFSRKDAENAKKISFNIKKLTLRA